MKILLIAQHAEPTDGWGTLARTTALGLGERGHTVELLLQKSTSSLACTQHTGLPTPLATLSNPLLILRTAWLVWRHIKRFQPDVIHVLTEPYALAFPFLPKKYRHPWVLTGCGTYTIAPFASRITAPLLRRVYLDVDAVLAISAYTKKRLEQEATSHSPALVNLSEKIQVYTLGIEFPKDMPQRREHDGKKILFVGGVKPRKGVLEIINACGAFAERSSVPFTLEIVGNLSQDTYVTQLKERVKKLGLADRVRFRGKIPADELAQAYADADLFIMLSIRQAEHFEGYGLVFLEANAFGVPAIGPDDSGCTNAISNGVSGYTVPPQDAEGVAIYMQKILEEHSIDPAACVQWAREHSIECQAIETEAIYSTLRTK